MTMKQVKILAGKLSGKSIADSNTCGGESCGAKKPAKKAGKK
jgi:hypothetical protein